jgi:hypothetical protein
MGDSALLDKPAVAPNHNATLLFSATLCKTEPQGETGRKKP